MNEKKRKDKVTRMVNVPMPEDDVLILHAATVLTDNRYALNRLIRRHIKPVALRLLKERREQASTPHSEGN